MSETTAATAAAVPAYEAGPARNAPLTTADGKPLKVAINAANARARRNAFFLVAPLLAFLLVTYTVPIVTMMSRSVLNPEVAQFLPNTSEAISAWDGEGLPPEDVFAAMVADLAAGERQTIGRVAARLNIPSVLRRAPNLQRGMRGAARSRGGPNGRPQSRKEATCGASRAPGRLQSKRETTAAITPAYYLRARSELRV